MTWSTITEIIFTRLATVIKSGEVIKNPFWTQHLLPSLIFAPYSKPTTKLLPSPTLNHSFSGESHLWCSLFLGKHWQGPCCLTPAMSVNLFMLHQWGLLAGFLAHCHAWEPQETGAQSKAASTTCNVQLRASSPWVVTSFLWVYWYFRDMHIDITYKHLCPGLIYWVIGALLFFCSLSGRLSLNMTFPMSCNCSKTTLLIISTKTSCPSAN